MIPQATSMPSRILSYILFWLLMILIILGSILVVFGLYLPFVAIKAVIMGLCGKIGGYPRDFPACPQRRAGSNSSSS